MAAVTALNYILDNIPDWMLRLDDLTTQISTRQVELAELTTNGKFKSLKHTGSTESLLPKETYMSSAAAVAAAGGDNNNNNSSGAAAVVPLTSYPLGSPSRLVGMQRQHMIQQARRKRKTTSIASGSGPSKYRTRSMIIVYYDSFVQEAFETLVRYIGTARNNIRKAKMEMKMAAISALADEAITKKPAEAGEDEDEEEAEAEAEARARIQMTMSRSRMGRSSGMMMMPPRRVPLSSPSAAMAPLTSPPAVAEAKTGYDIAEEALEQAQGLCEHAAHQFLRDGDCDVEISGIKKRLVDSLAAMQAERAKLDDVERKKREKEELEQAERDRLVEAEEKRKRARREEEGEEEEDTPMGEADAPTTTTTTAISPTMMKMEIDDAPAKEPTVEAVALEPGGGEVDEVEGKVGDAPRIAAAAAAERE